MNKDKFKEVTAKEFWHWWQEYPNIWPERVPDATFDPLHVFYLDNRLPGEYLSKCVGYTVSYDARNNFEVKYFILK